LSKYAKSVKIATMVPPDTTSTSDLQLNIQQHIVSYIYW